MDETLDLAAMLAISAGVGLLVGLERERHPSAKAGLRTFTLIALAGSLATLLADAADSGWVFGAALLVIGAAVAGASFVDPETRADDSGTTTVVAALVVFCLGALNAYGYRLVTVALGIGMTALLHFKVELEGAVQRLTPTDIRSMLQFGAVSAVILPLLPNEPHGPYGVLNPFHIWLMVVLISGVSLAGYIAWRLTLARGGLLLTGTLGGLVSSTATTLVYARHARRGVHSKAAALIVIVLANTTMFARLLLIVTIVAPQAAAPVAAALVPGFVLAVPVLAMRWRAAPHVAGGGLDEYRNPTNLFAALAFAAGYAVVLVLAAWASERIGTQGVYGLAFASGLTDVDAIALSVLQLFNAQALPGHAAGIAIGLAAAANLLLKAALVFVAGGASIGRATALSFAPPLLGLIAGMAWLHALA
jgi:uncharacterized membrane protein (DUF4010 family)